MAGTSYISLLDDICKLYHPSLRFPISLDTLSTEGSSCNLLQIGTALDYELSTSHLSRHDMILIISNGSNGKELINYLYKELIFTNTTDNTTNEYYYVCPYRSTEDCDRNNLLFITKNLNNNEKDKINDRINMIPVVTDEEQMKMVSTFLVQVSNASSLSVTNALIDTIIQNKANKIFMILNSSVISNNEILYYEDMIKSIVESGYIRKLNLFVNFNAEQLAGSSDSSEALKEQQLLDYNTRLQKLFQNREFADMVKGLKYNGICVPSDVRLIEHLLGVQTNQLESFSNYLSHLNGSIAEVVASQPDSSRVSPRTDASIAQMNEILSGVNTLKLNYAINKLQNDLQSLTNINSKLISKNRNLQRKNHFITLLHYYKEVQDYLIMLLLTVTLFMNIATSQLLTSLLLKLKVTNFNVPARVRNLSSKFNRKGWAFFYLLLFALYFGFRFVDNKYLLPQAFDKKKYVQQKNFLKHLNEQKARLREIKKRVN